VSVRVDVDGDGDARGVASVADKKVDPSGKPYATCV
jgi:hypothetical protein